MECILLASELDPASHVAFETALRLAHSANAELLVHHSVEDDDDVNWQALPTPHELLSHWGILPADATLQDALDQGPRVVPIASPACGDVPSHVVATSRAVAPDLVVLGYQEDHEGVGGILQPSVPRVVIDRYGGPCLLVPLKGQRLVGAAGSLRLERILVSVPAAGQATATDTVTHLLEICGQTRASIVIVRSDAPDVVPATRITERLPQVRWRSVVPPASNRTEGTLTAIDEHRPDLVVLMHQAGDRGWMSELWPSTVHEVLKQQGVPVLLVPGPPD